MSISQIADDKILLLACGDIGIALGGRLQREGAQVTALRRNIDALPASMDGIALDYSKADDLSALADLEFDAAVMTPTPANSSEQGYLEGILKPVCNLLNLWREGPARRLVYVSSTRVYGDRGGDWVDESTALAPADAQARLLAEAESRLLGSRHEVTVVRFSGIYGRHPSRLLQRLNRGQVCAALPSLYSNRIHREDCVGFLAHLLKHSPLHSLYLATDSRPALRREVEEWLLQALGRDIDSELGVRAGASRRCRNSRMLETGYELTYPDYRAGYSAMINSTSMATALGSAAT
jgi:nucleoside-diphosphate-sugar epimerase